MDPRRIEDGVCGGGGGVPLASRGGERTVIEVTLGKAAALGYNEG